jgi:hypothetical protein
MPAVCEADAILVFDNLPSRLRAPSLHPGYVLSDATRADSLSPTFFVYQSGGESFYHAFHTEAVHGITAIDVQSPYGYGGPVATTTDAHFLSEAWTEYHQWCQENDVLVEFMRFHPCLENWRFFSGEVWYDRDTVWLDLSRTAVMDGYAVRSRTAVRKAVASGVKCEWVAAESFLEEFPQLYLAAMNRLGASDAYRFSDAYFTKLVATSPVWMGLCRKGATVVSGAIFLVGESLVEYHLSASSELGRTLAATNLLIHRAAERAQSEERSALHLGGGNDSSPDNTLLFFKRGFSKLTAEFKIGRRIHQPSAYENLERTWQAERGEVSRKVLFYRT